MNEKTFARFVDDLSSNDYAKVEDAANTLCALRDSNILPFIIKTLEEATQPLVQRVMLLTLCNYDNLDYCKFLPFLVNTEEDVKEAAQTLFLKGKKGGFSVLVNALQESDDVQLKCSIVSTLGQYHNDDVIVPLLSSLNDSSEVVRVVTLYSLASYRQPEITEAILCQLKDHNEEIVEEALFSLRGRDFSKNQLMLIAELLNNSNPDIRSAAVSVMDIHVPDKMVNDSEAKVRRSVAEVSLTSNVLSQLCRDENSSVRMAAIDSIAKNGFKMDDILIPLVHDENPGVRRSVATALGNSSEHEVIQALIVLLNDSKPGVSAAAARSLCKIGGNEAKVALENFKNTNNPILSGIIKESLSQFK